MSTSPIAILGAGNAATALALLLSRHGRQIRLYCIEPEVEHDINANACNTKYLAGIKLPKNICAYPDLKQTVHQADIVLVAVPSFAIYETIEAARPYFSKQVCIASITKGLDQKTLQPLAIEVAKRLPKQLRTRLCVIAGPAVANELAQHQPAAFLIAGPDASVTKTFADLFHTDVLKVATSKDLLGAGLCMALKNVYAIALGMCDGLKFPMNSKALLTALAVEEMEGILRASKANPDTAAGLAGLGDLLVTGFSSHGRNRTYGEKLVGSKTADPTKLGLGTVEGIAATKAASKLIRTLGVSAPLLQTVVRCLKQTSSFEKPLLVYLKKLKLH